jgi:hypothetical protein
LAALSPAQIAAMTASASDLVTLAILAVLEW